MFASSRILAAAALMALPLSVSAQKVLPAKAGTDSTTARWTFTSGPATLKSGAKGAGRIISLQYNGSEVLHMDTATATNYGSTFWPSPQAGWTSNWPPAANIDGAGAYAATEVDSTLILRGQTDANNKVRINKQYWANAKDTSFSMRFTLINTNTVAKAWAPWQDTRIPAGGLYIFPKGTDTVSGQLASFVKDSAGYRWYKYDSATALTSGTNKFYADGSQGWYAHVNKNRVLLIKKFTDTPHAKKAPGVEKEIELYTTNDKKFIEMEAQGSYDTIPAGDSITWNVKWYLRKLPDTTTVAAFNMNIVNTINAVLAAPVSVNGAVSAPVSPAYRLGFSGNRVSVDLQKNADVSLSIVNANGREISRVHSGRLAQGHHEFALNASMPKGVYWLVLKDASRPGILGMHKLIWLAN
jgi:hypothetical protein